MQDELSVAEPDGYEPFFGLAEAPFKLTSNPRFLFESASYLAAFKEIGYALSRREQIIVVTGPIGTGKTMLCRMIDERRGPRSFINIIKSPPETRDDLFRQVLDGFGLLTEDTRLVIEASHFGLVKVFHRFLDSLISLNAQATLVFDESQRLNSDVLEEIRLLLNLENDRQLLQLVLVGQPELDTVLARTELGQMQQRISRRHRLKPLQPAEVSAYIAHRLAVAQGDGPGTNRPTFEDGAVQAIATLSSGVPRVVNILCDRSLENAWSDRTRTIDAATVVRAARSLRIDVPSSLAPPEAPAAGAPVAVAPSIAAPTRSTPPNAPPAFTPPPSASPMKPLPVMMRPKDEIPEWARPPAPTKSVRLKRSHAQMALATVLVLAALFLIWIIIRGPADATPRAAVDALSRPPAAVDAPSRPPAAPAPGGPTTTTPPAAPTRPSPSAPVVAAATRGNPASAQPRAAGADPFFIVVASFKTRERASLVVADIAKLGLPSSVRTYAGWEQVVVGPYASRQEADAAHEKLAAAHFAEMEVTQNSAAPASSPSAAPRAAAPASAPISSSLPLGELLRRASTFASQGDVRGLQEIRNQVIARQQGASPEQNEALTAALDQLERNLDEARRRQLDEDRRRLSGNR